MSLQHTNSTKHWGSIPKKCKSCSKAIFTKENGEIFFQCSIYGVFKRTCSLKTETRILPKPEEISIQDNK